MTPTKRAVGGTGRNPVLTNHNDRLQLANPVVPLFEWVTTGARTVEAQDFCYLTGEMGLRVPFRPEAGDSTIPGVQVPESPLAFNLDTTGLGGLVDGIALAASTDYLLWAFQTSTLENSLYGVGITSRPVVAIPAATGVVSGGGLGSTGVFNCTTAGHANRVTEGARVLIYEGTTLGSNYNQGTVTDVDTGTNRISVALDAAYSLGLNTNTTLAGAAAKTLVQLTCFEPRAISETTTVFDGKPFVYLGSLQTNSSSNIRRTRKRGDLLELITAATFRSQAGITANENVQAGLGNWLPLHAIEVYAIAFANITSGTPGQARVTVGTDTTSPVEIDCRSAIGGNIIFTPQPGVLTPLVPSCSVQVAYIETGTLTVSYQVAIHKYRETAW
jgi:hypothetical protein